MTTNATSIQSKPRAKAVSLDSARAIASEYIARADHPEAFDAGVVLGERPELWDHKSVVLDLAYEEFLRKAESGQQLQVSQFVARFPQWQQSLLRMLQVHDFLDASPELAPCSWPQIGDEFAGFDLQEELGRGAFSRVFLAREPGVGGRSVVVKAVANVHSDADVLGRLQHPNIVPVYSVSHDEGFGLTAICMPYLGRATLYDVLQISFGEDDTCPRRGIVLHEALEQANQHDEGLLAPRGNDPFSGVSYVDAVLELAIQVTEALKYVHRQGIYHCDIKPSNVLLTSSGEAKLFDFNLALLAGDSKPEQVGGTLAYMAPELLESFANGDAAGDIQVDARTDLFSFGVMLFELFTGKLPFKLPGEMEDRRQFARRLLERQHAGSRPLTNENSSVSRSLAEVVERCLESLPERRHPSAAELLEGLKRERSRRQQTSRRRFVAAMVTGGLVLGAGAASIIAGRWQDESAVAGNRESALAKAKAAFEAGNFADAVKYYTEALAEDPTNLRIQFSLGHANLYAGNYAEALRHYRDVEESGLDDADVLPAILRARFHRGCELASAEQFAAAHSQFREGQVAAQNLAEFENERNILRVYEGFCRGQMPGERNKSDAIILLNECAISPQLNNISLYNNIGYCQKEIGLEFIDREDLNAARSNFESAMSSFEAAIKMDESQHTPHRNLAYLSLSLCETSEIQREDLDWAANAVGSIDRALFHWTSDAQPGLERDAMFYEATFVAASAADIVSEIEAETSKEYVDLAISYARKAMQAGLSWTRFAILEKEGQVWKSAEFLNLRTLDRGNSDSGMNHSWMMDPLLGLRNQKALGQLHLPR